LPYHCYVILSGAKNLKTCSGEALASTGKCVVRPPSYRLLNTEHTTHKVTQSPARQPRSIRILNHTGQILHGATANASSPTAKKRSPQPLTHLPDLCVRSSVLLSQLIPLNVMPRPIPNMVIAGANCLNVSIITCAGFIFVTSYVDNYTTPFWSL
jgi:hypothetical protein